MPESFYPVDGGSSTDLNELKQYENCGWDSIYYLAKRPDLTSERTLAGRISSYNNQLSNKVQIPSGFFKVGKKIHVSSISDDSGANPGDIITANDLINTIYLASEKTSNETVQTDKGYYACVNGWIVNISSTNLASGYNNLIDVSLKSSTADTAQTQSLVFLEVWSKPFTYRNDSVLKYGNQETPQKAIDSDNTDGNDLRDLSIKVETTRRVQIQYRIRVVDTIKLTGDLAMKSSYARGGSSSESTMYFSKCKDCTGNYNLYRAGDGSSLSMEKLMTTDGYSYAIPMFLIGHRKEGSFGIDQKSSLKNAPTSEGTTYTLRPDGKFSDVVYPSDIIDLRNKIITSTDNLEEVLSSTFSSVAMGIYEKKSGKVIGSSGFESANFGTLPIKTERYGYIPGSDEGFHSAGSSILSRRVSLPGRSIQRNCVFNLAISGMGVYYVLPSVFGVSKIELNTDNGGSLSKFVFDENGLVKSDYTITNDSTTNGIKVEGQPANGLFLKCDIEWDSAGSFGFADVPTRFLQQNFINSEGIEHYNAVYGVPLDLYKRSSIYTEKNVNFIECLGRSYRDHNEFGQIAKIKLYPTGESYVFSLGEYNRLPGTNQEVIGLRSVRLIATISGEAETEISDGTQNSYYTTSGFSLTEPTSSAGILTIKGLSTYSYVLEITLYLGTKYAMLFDNQCGIQDIVESRCVDAVYSSEDSSFTVSPNSSEANSSPVQIIGVSSLLTGTVSNPSAHPYYLKKNNEDVWDNELYTNSKMIEYPVTTSDKMATSYSVSSYVSPSKIRINISNSSAEIKAPVFLLNGIDETEGLLVAYETRGFQGIESTYFNKLSVVSESSAIITSKGTGGGLLNYLSFDDVIFTTSPTTASWKTEDAQFSDLMKFCKEGYYLLLNKNNISYIPDRFADMYRIASITEASGIYTITFAESDFYPALPTSAISGKIIKPNPEFCNYRFPIGSLPSLTPYLYKGESLINGYNTIFVKANGREAINNSQSYLRMGSTSAIVVEPSSSIGSYDLIVDTTYDSFTGTQGTSSSEMCLKYINQISNPNINYQIYQPLLVRVCDNNSEYIGKLFMVIVGSTYTSGKIDASLCPFEGRDIVSLYEINGSIVGG